MAAKKEDEVQKPKAVLTGPAASGARKKGGLTDTEILDWIDGASVVSEYDGDKPGAEDHVASFLVHGEDTSLREMVMNTIRTNGQPESLVEKIKESTRSFFARAVFRKPFGKDIHYRFSIEGEPFHVNVGSQRYTFVAHRRHSQWSVYEMSTGSFILRRRNKSDALKDTGCYVVDAKDMAGIVFDLNQEIPLMDLAVISAESAFAETEKGG